MIYWCILAYFSLTSKNRSFSKKIFLLKCGSSFLYFSRFFCFIIKYMGLEKAPQKFVHLLHKVKFWIQARLERLDNLSSFIKIPLAVFFLIIGLIFFYIPFINGMIFLFIGSRMLGRNYMNKLFRFLRIENNRRYTSYREALFHILKK